MHPKDREKKKILGDWYDTSKWDKAKEKRKQKRDRSFRRIKSLQWFIVATIMFALSVFLLNNFDNFFEREHTVIMYMGRGELSGFFILVYDREEPVWLHQLEWENLHIGQEVVLRETRQGTRIEEAPLSMFQRIFQE